MLTSIPSPFFSRGENLVYCFLIYYPTPSPSPLITRAEWSGVIYQSKPEYTCNFCTANGDSGWNSCVFPHSIVHICNNLNSKNTHPNGGPKAKHTYITIDISSQIFFFIVGIPLYTQILATPLSSGRRLPFFQYRLYFWCVGHWSWDVCRPAHIRPFLIQEIDIDTYDRPLLVISSMLQHK